MASEGITGNMTFKPRHEVGKGGEHRYLAKAQIEKRKTLSHGRGP